ncbi:hypothetical protein UK23_15045 [Lentzea aerocolonigenes]|uniref:Uncharacterized protein n=1 Tax=Lentzea aerocolonigenes TaxID=68170 RepID=A0A0F0H613_LENAE|nr:hypothetical protein [Lentzea aerocolonigenes]KJK49043.1 hypothetical protein UK23_15045 [Lentzea aerocolonigenes]
MKCCGRGLTEAELVLLDSDPALVPDELVQKVAWHSPTCFDRDEYEAAWRRLTSRVIQVLHNAPDSQLTAGLWWARWTDWPEDERAAFRAEMTEVLVSAAGDERRWPGLDAVFQAAAQLDQDLTPWLRLVDGFPDAVVAHLADFWSLDVWISGGHYGSRLLWENPSATEQLVAWLVAPALRDRLSEMDGQVAQRAVEQIGWHLLEISTR